MFHNQISNQQKADSQAELSAATLRTLVDLRLVCNPESTIMTARRPFRLNTQFGAWTGAMLSNAEGAVAVQSQQLNGDIISPNTRAGRDLSWSLRQVGIYTRGKVHNLSEWQQDLRELQEHAESFQHNGWQYQPTPLLNILRALGAPDPCVEIGHFTYHQPVAGVDNVQVLGLSGQVARTPWRAFLLPTMKQLEFCDGGGIC